MTILNAWWVLQYLVNTSDDNVAEKICTHISKIDLKCSTVKMYNRFINNNAHIVEQYATYNKIAKANREYFARLLNQLPSKNLVKKLDDFMCLVLQNDIISIFDVIIILSDYYANTKEFESVTESININALCAHAIKLCMSTKYILTNYLDNFIVFVYKLSCHKGITVTFADTGISEGKSALTHDDNSLCRLLIKGFIDGLPQVRTYFPNLYLCKYDVTIISMNMDNVPTSKTIDQLIVDKFPELIKFYNLVDSAKLDRLQA